MKKTSIISIIVFIAVILFMAFTFNTAADVQKTSIGNPQGNILVHVTGCDNCDKLFVCVDGHVAYYPGTCDFYVDCYPAGAVSQTICVVCGLKSGIVTIDCKKTKEVKIPVFPGGIACPCNSK